MGGEKWYCVEKSPSKEAKSHAGGPAMNRSGKEKGGQNADGVTQKDWLPGRGSCSCDNETDD